MFSGSAKCFQGTPNVFRESQMFSGKPKTFQGNRTTFQGNRKAAEKRPKSSLKTFGALEHVWLSRTSSSTLGIAWCHSGHIFTSFMFDLCVGHQFALGASWVLGFDFHVEDILLRWVWDALDGCFRMFAVSNWRCFASRPSKSVDLCLKRTQRSSVYLQRILCYIIV